MGARPIVISALTGNKFSKCKLQLQQPHDKRRTPSYVKLKWREDLKSTCSFTWPVVICHRRAYKFSIDWKGWHCHPMYYSLCEVKRILLVCRGKTSTIQVCRSADHFWSRQEQVSSSSKEQREGFASAIPNSTSTFYFSDGLQRPSRREFSSSSVDLLAFFFFWTLFILSVLFFR